MATNGILKFQGTNKATFVGGTSNVVIDTVKSSLGIGVDVDGPTSNLHVVGNAYVSTELTVGGTVTAAGFAGNASTASALATPVNIGGVAFDGSAAITLPGVNSGGNQNTSGSAATLTTPRAIGGVNFDGSANITLPGVNSGGNQNTSGSAATLTTARSIGGVAFDGSAAIVPTTFGAATFSGDVGIGTTSPVTPLEVSQPSGYFNSMYIQKYLGVGPELATSYVLLLKSESSSPKRLAGKIQGVRGYSSINTAFEAEIIAGVGSGAALSGRMTLNYSGTTNSFYAKLVSLTYSSSTYIALALIPTANYNGMSGGIYFDGKTNAIAELQYITDLATLSNIVDFPISGGDKTTFTGNVGIGIAAPTNKLHIEGSTTSAILKRDTAAAVTNYNYIINAPRPGTSSGGATLFINGSSRTGDGNTNKLTLRNDSGSVDIGSRSATFVSNHNPAPETYNAVQQNVDIMLNNGSIWMSPYTGRHRDLGTGAGTWSQYIGKHYLGRILAGIEIENRNDRSNGTTGVYYSNLLHFRAHDHGTYEGRTMTVRGNKVGILTQAPTYTMHVNGSLFYSSGGLNGSDDRIKYNEENVTNALDIIGKLKPQKYEKIMAFPSDAKGTWIPTDENWETVKNAETKPWEGFAHGNEFGFIAQDVRNIPEVSFLVSGSEMKTSDESVSPEEHANLNEEEQGNYTFKYIYEENVITVEEYTDLTPENKDKCTEIYTKRVETQTPLGLNYQGIFVIAVKAIQELKEENETLKSQLTSVLTRLDALENPPQ